MEEKRTLAYQLATILDEKELDQIFGGSNPIIIPTITVTGAPLLPDSIPDH